MLYPSKFLKICMNEEFEEFLIKILADKVAIIPQSLIPVKFVTPNIQKSRSNHQSIPKMITTAIEKLKDRKGSSLQAIEKYIVEKYKLDVKQTTGKGASESFKFSITKSKDVKTSKMQRYLVRKKKKKNIGKSVKTKMIVTDNSKKSKALTKKIKVLNSKANAAIIVTKNKITKKQHSRRLRSKIRRL
ncbi:histone H1-like [Vespula maculifrons]|uniref:Histone H1-like n=1 Tax=Vespula maculifrons TaxID=7453 RepID=A0ABD2BL70_VESMC